MALGFGFLKQMNDSIRYNKEILGKKKSVQEVQKDKIKNQTLTFSKESLEFVRSRVSSALHRNKTAEIISRCFTLTLAGLVILLLVGGSWVLISKLSFITPAKYANKSALFTTVEYNQGDNTIHKIDYYPKGSKAAETFLKNGLKHQNSESYYQTGEQFRSALYYYDTLVTEVYFFKNGDTIKNFPLIADSEAHHIKAVNKSNSTEIQFDFYDGKIIHNTYREIPLKR